MDRAIWIHQVSQLSEQQVGDIANTLLPRGITSAYLKSMDGADWMSQFTSGPLVPSNVLQMAYLTDLFGTYGMRLVPWVVNRYNASEADRHIECGSAAGGLIIDFEYQYGGFWKGTDSELKGYFDKLRAAVAGGLWVGVAPDPRQCDRDYRTPLIAGMSAYLPQDYWTDFQADAIDVLTDSFQRLAQFGPVEPILPYNATPDDMRAALAYCYGQGATSVSLWRMGTANAAQLDAFAERVDGEQEPEPDMSCEHEKAAIERAVNRLQIELARQTASGKPAPIRKSIIKEIAGELFNAL